MIEYEVVLSSGEIVKATAQNNKDLFIALKGGSNNFGVVTQFKLPTFQQGRMWGGAVFMAPDTFPELASRLYDFVTSPTDPDAHLIVAAGYAPAGAATVSNVYYAKPEPMPPSLAPFTTVQPVYMSTLREDSLLGFASEQAAFSNDGDRQLYFTTTFRPNKQFLLDIHKLWQSTVDANKHIPGFTLSLVFQPLSKSLLEASAAKGGNSLGFSPERGPLLLNLLNSVHSNKEDDEAMVKAITGLLKSIENLAAERGLADRYRFMNYSFKSEKVVQSYGGESIAKLKAASKKYDKIGFFQRKVPGGFKLPG